MKIKKKSINKKLILFKKIFHLLKYQEKFYFIIKYREQLTEKSIEKKLKKK